MSADAVMDVQPVPTVPPRRIVAGLLVLTFVLVTLLALPIGFEVGIRRIPPDAVQVSATSGTDGRTLATRVITDQHIVADLYARINNLPPAGEGIYRCSLPGFDAIQYHFGFKRWGVLVEAATPPVAGCGEWSVSRGGLDDPRLDTTDAKQAIVAEVQPLLFQL